MPKNKNNRFLMSFVPQTQINLEPPNVIKKEHQVVDSINHIGLTDEADVMLTETQQYSFDDCL